MHLFDAEAGGHPPFRKSVVMLVWLEHMLNVGIDCIIVTLSRAFCLFHGMV
jgi:hypothetical protein